VFTRIGPVFSGNEMSALRVVNCSLTCLGFGWKSLGLADETNVSVAIFLIYQIGNCRDLNVAARELLRWPNRHC